MSAFSLVIELKLQTLFNDFKRNLNLLGNWGYLEYGNILKELSGEGKPTGLVCVAFATQVPSEVTLFKCIENVQVQVHGYINKLHFLIIFFLFLCHSVKYNVVL